LFVYEILNCISTLVSYSMCVVVIV